MELPILYEDTDLVVIGKPVGVMTHPDGRTKAETVSDWFLKKYPESGAVGEPITTPAGEVIPRPGVVHRLDTDTSGALVLAKNAATYTFLKQAFESRAVKKTYLAFAYGVPKQKRGVINFDIGRSQRDFRLRSAQPGAGGTLRNALTQYEVVSDIGTHTLFRLQPETGRTHQIRVHLKAIHHPVVCDKLYAPNRACDLGFKRLGLHAYALDLPVQAGGRKEVVAPIPPDLASAFLKFPNTDGFLRAP